MHYSRHHQEWPEVIWFDCLSALLVRKGLPCTPQSGIWACNSLIFLPLSFWGTRLPFWFLLSVALNSVTDITVVSQDIAYVCVCVYAMSGSSGRQPGILFLNFGSCCTAPHIMASLLKVGYSSDISFQRKTKPCKPILPREQEQSSLLKIFFPSWKNKRPQKD